MTQEKTVTKDFLGLRAKREALGMTLKDVFAVTRISVVNLEAIENGDFQSLPVPTYARNFIKTYAQALNLDSKPILESYEAYLNSLQTPQVQTQKIQEQETVHEEEVVPEKEPSVEGKRPARYKALVAMIFILIVVAVAGIAIYQQQQPVPMPTDSKSPIAPTVPQTPVNTSATPPANQAAAPAAGLSMQSAQTAQPDNAQQGVTEVNKQVSAQPGVPQQKDQALAKLPPKKNVPSIEKKEPVLNSEGGDVLLIKATEETWLRIKIDQNPPFQVLLKPGEVFKRKGTAFGMEIGNAGGIKVQFKGKAIENLGKSGEVVYLQLP